jgi:hypothetical protein
MELTKRQTQLADEAKDCLVCQAISDILALRSIPLGAEFAAPSDLWVSLIKEHLPHLTSYGEAAFDELLFSQQEGLALAYGIRSAFQRSDVHPFGLVWTFQSSAAVAQEEFDILAHKAEEGTLDKISTRALYFAIVRPRAYAELDFVLPDQVWQSVEARWLALSREFPVNKETAFTSTRPETPEYRVEA